ncbi:MAG: CHAT domain-containing protein [Nonlabens sp.]
MKNPHPLHPLILTVLLIISTICKAQLNPLPIYAENPIKTRMDQAITSKNYDQAIKLGSELCNSYHDAGQPYSDLAQVLYQKGKSDLALTFDDWSIGMWTYETKSNYHGILHSLYAKDQRSADKFFKNFQSVGLAGNVRDYYRDQINDMINYLSKYQGHNATVAYARKKMATFDADCLKYSKAAYENLIKSLSAKAETIANNAEAEKVLDEWLATKTAVESGLITRELYADALANLSSLAEKVNFKFGQKLMPYQEAIVYDSQNYGLASRYRTYQFLASVQAALKRWDLLKSSSNYMLTELKGKAPVNAVFAKPYFYLIMAEAEQGNHQDAANLADSYTSLVDQFTDPEMVAEAYYVMLRAYAFNKDMDKGKALVVKAKQFLANPNLAELASAEFVKNGISSTANILDKKDEVVLTENHYSNGLALVAAKKYTQATTEFKKAQNETISELDKMTPQEQRGYVDKLQRINGNLAACYQETKQFDKLFDVIESNRAYNLVNNKRSGKKQISLQELQSQLAPDEAYLSLIDITKGSTYDGSYLMCLVKKNKVYTRYNRSAGPFELMLDFDKDALIKLEKELAKQELRSPNLDYLTGKKQRKPGMFGLGEYKIVVEYLRKHLKADIVNGQYSFYQPENMKMVLTAFYNQFMDGLAAELNGINRLTISPEGVTSVIPFDALMDFEGNYMASKYEIGYAPSAAVLVSLRKQPKRNYEKNVLAFGGATYDLYNAQKAPLNSLGDLEKIRFKVKESIGKNQPLDYAFATFQGDKPMVFLSGGRKEVVVITETVPKSDAKLDDQMTENELKRMSKSGELGKYRAIHLSSHASVHPYVFDLSSFAMTVNPQPVNGEDGMVVVSEMEQLDLPVDFVMLSACQTALGMESPGDGVKGLNQALFNAGANSTLTSLWSVSDSGTMYLSVELYDQMFNKNMNTMSALAQVKRNFINGKYGDQTHPYFWAPFIYTGY